LSNKSALLIDNSILSAVDRLTGESKILNLYNTDNDIACFEKLITAIVLSDDLYGINDYKEKYAQSRLKKYKFVNFLNLSPEEYSDTASYSANFAKDMLFSFSGSQPAGDVVHFFEALRIDPQMRWNVFTSSEYLTLSLLVKERKDTHYESTVAAAFGNESADQARIASKISCVPQLAVNDQSIDDIKQLVHAFSQGNSQYKGSGTKDMLDKLIFGYGWVAERSCFYSTIANARDMETALSPLRDAFCESCCRIDSPQAISRLIEEGKRSTRDAVLKIVSVTGEAKFILKMPFFTSYFISKAKNPSEVINMALDYKSRPEFRVVLDLLFNLRHLDASDRRKEVNSMLDHMNRAGANLIDKFGVSGSQGESFSISLGMGGPEISKSIKLSQLFRERRNKPFAKLFRSMATDILNVERMGALYDKMRSQIVHHEDASYFPPSTTPSFMRDRESEYGRPAIPGV
jgi:hypothetical protein